MWAIEYVQVPIAKEKSLVDNKLSPPPSISGGGITATTHIKTDSNCSLASDDDPASVKDEEEDEEDESPTKVRMALNVTSLQQKRPSLVSAKSLHEQINNIVSKQKGK